MSDNLYDKAALEKAFKAIRPSHLARQIGVTPQAIAQWDRVPVKHVLSVERITGVPRHELRPDIYPPNEAATV